MEKIKLEYTLDDIVQAALTDTEWSVPEEERFFLYGVDEMLVIV